MLNKKHYKEILCCLFLFCGFFFGFLVVISGKQQIPFLFNMEEQPDSYDSKWSVFFLPCTATIVYILITFIQTHPKLYNIPWMKKKTKEEAIKLTNDCIGQFKTVSVFFFILLEIISVLLPSLFLWISIVLIFVYIYLFIKYLKSL